MSINGERKALLDIDPKMAEVTTSLTLKTPPIHVTAGAQRVTAAFLQRFEGPVNDLIAPIDHTLADTQIGVAYGITTLPHLKDLSIVGPQHVTGVSETREPPTHFHLPPGGAGRGDGLRDADRQAPRDAGVPPAGSANRSSGADALLRRRTQGARLRNGVAAAHRSDPGEPAVRVPARADRRRAARPAPRERCASPI